MVGLLQCFPYPVPLWQAVIWYHEPVIIGLQETDLYPFHALNLQSYVAQHYCHLDGDGASGGMEIFFCPTSYHCPFISGKCVVHHLAHLSPSSSTCSSRGPNHSVVRITSSIHYSWWFHHQKYSLQISPYWQERWSSLWYMCAGWDLIFLNASAVMHHCPKEDTFFLRWTLSCTKGFLIRW